MHASRGAIPLAAAAMLAVCVPQGAEAVDEVFTVANYPVEARADNAVAAKERALADGQQAAFRSLLKRLVTVTAYPRIKRLASVQAGDLVEGLRVRSERNSSTDYIASLDFSFQSKAVRDLLRREGIPFTDEQAPALFVIPLWRTGAGAPRDQAAWSNVWKGLDLEHALTPVKLQALKKEITPAAIDALAGGDGSAIRAFVAAYGTEYILIAVAERDTAANRLNVTLSGRDAVGAFTLKRGYRVDAGDPGYASELAAVISLGILEGRWKAIKSRGGAAAARHRRCRPSCRRGVPRHERMAGHQPQAQRHSRRGGAGSGGAVRARRPRHAALRGGRGAARGSFGAAGLELAQCGRQLGALLAIGARRPRRRAVKLR